ncbi:uncharacterized protein [Littorina saxatilis]|uniref:uncharacterized protein n=1 Tax=Littorina saxatilis TaxID=31220 RepID=UPI0038B53E41
MDRSKLVAAPVLILAMVLAGNKYTTKCTISRSGEKATLTCDLPSTSKAFSVRRNGSSRKEHVLDCEGDHTPECIRHIARLGLYTPQSEGTDQKIEMINVTDDDEMFSYKCEVDGHPSEACSFPAEPSPPSSYSSNGSTSTSVPAESSQVTPTTSQNVSTQTTIPRNSAWSSPGDIVGYVLSLGVGVIFGLAACLGCRKKSAHSPVIAIASSSQVNTAEGRASTESRTADSAVIAMEDIPTSNASSSQENTAEGRARSTSRTYGHGDDRQVDGGNMAAATPEGCEEELELVHQLKESWKHRQHIFSQVDGGNVAGATPEGYEKELELLNQLEEKIKQQQMFCQLRTEAQVQATPSTTASSAGSSVNRLTLNSTDEPTASAMTTPITCTEAEQPRPNSVQATDNESAVLYLATEVQEKRYPGLLVNESVRSSEQRGSGSRRGVRDLARPEGFMLEETRPLLPEGQPKNQQGSAEPD